MPRNLPATHWFVGDGYIFDDLAPQFRTSGAEANRPRECSSKLLLYNPGAKPAAVNARFYHPDRSPTAIQRRVPAGAIETIELAELTEIPHRQSFWIEVQSDVPILPQARHEDYTFWDPVPDAMVSPTPVAGPLKTQTVWIHPDCFQGGATSWHEQETLTILNPGEKEVTVRVQYLLREADRGAQEQIKIAPRRIAQLNVWERHPAAIGLTRPQRVAVLGDYAVRLDSTGPIISQSTRRARWRGYPQVIGARSSIGFPLPAKPPTLWYYPAGFIANRHNDPRDFSLGPWDRTDVNWNLLFIHNPDEKHPAHATVHFHNSNGTATTARIEVPPMRSTLSWLHDDPWVKEHVSFGEPFAMTVQADRPVVPEVCGAEFDIFSQIMPGGMTSVNFYPGPLKTEKLWWLGLGQVGTRPDSPVDWRQTWHFFNPGRRPATVRLSFHGSAAAAKVEKTVDVPPNAVTMILSEHVPGLPAHQPFAVRAQSNVPIVAQTIGYTLTRGLKHIRATYSLMGLPIPLFTKSE